MEYPPHIQKQLTPVVTLGRDSQVIYALQPKQLECYKLTPLYRGPDEAYPRHIGYGGAAGAAKSHLARAVGTAAALGWPGSRGIIFRETKDDVNANHVDYFRNEVPEKIDGQQLYSYNGERMCATFINGSQFFFGFLRDENDLRRYHGREYDWMVFEESTQFIFKLVRWLTGNRLRATVPGSRPFVIYPTNPGGVGHAWYSRLFVRRKFYKTYNEVAENYAFVQGKVHDNLILCWRDPDYVKELDTLPEPYRAWYRDGDWEAGLGQALPMLDPDVHIVQPFDVPEHWPVFGAFDWGYAHPYCFGLYTVNEDGRHFKIDTLKGRGQQDDEMARTILERIVEHCGISIDRVRTIWAGHDSFAEIRARGENAPTTAETFAKYGIYLTPANISRVNGLKNLRTWLSWEGMGDIGTDGKREDIIPRFVFFDTPGNREAVEVMAELPTDPKKPEDALKQDADEFGRGGDDDYDETRYGMASRQVSAVSKWAEMDTGAWTPDVLEAEAERGQRGHTRQLTKDDMIHHEFGDQI